MPGVALPRADQSGSHRVIDVDVGNVRQAIAALSSVATLARSHAVGARALGDLLPELRSTCVALPATVANALLPSCDIVVLSTGLFGEADSALEGLVGTARAAAGTVLETIDAAERRGLGARTRLSLQAACEVAALQIASVCHSIELLQRASTGEPVPVALEDILTELREFKELNIDGLVSTAPGVLLDDIGGCPVELALVGAIDADVVVHPRVAMSILMSLLSRTRLTVKGKRFTAAAEIARDRVIVELRARNDEDVPKDAFEVTVPRTVPFDDVILRLAAATLAAPLEFRPDLARVHLLRV